MKNLTTALMPAILLGLITGSAIAQEGEKSSGQEVTVTGEVVDMSCYIDHGATGEKHAACAKKCIASGLPAGIKASDGKTYHYLVRAVGADGRESPISNQVSVTIR